MSFLFDRLYALSYKEKPTETTLLLSLLLKSYPRPQAASDVANLDDLVDIADRAGERGQVRRLREGALDRGRALVDGRERASADLKLGEVVVASLESVLGVAVALRDDGAGLEKEAGEKEVRGSASGSDTSTETMEPTF